jgi:hypothetical protein
MLAAAILLAFFTFSALHCEKPEYFKFLVRVIPPCLYLYLYLYVVESLLGYETTGERAQLVAYGATTCS